MDVRNLISWYCFAVLSSTRCHVPWRENGLRTVVRLYKQNRSSEFLSAPMRITDAEVAWKRVFWFQYLLLLLGARGGGGNAAKCVPRCCHTDNARYVLDRIDLRSPVQTMCGSC